MFNSYFGKSEWKSINSICHYILCSYIKVIKILSSGLEDQYYHVTFNEVTHVQEEIIDYLPFVNQKLNDPLVT